MSDYATPAVRLAGHDDAPAMPLLGFGTWQIPDEEATEATEQALAAGYRHIDTATGYGNEAGIGKALAGSDLDRDQIFVTTKMPPDNVGKERQTLEESLAKLGIDQVDLWLVHWPPNGEATPKAWEQFAAAQADGLTRHIGVSNYSLEQIDELTSAVGVTPSVNQIKWSPVEYRADIARGLSERNVVLEGYSPFKASNLDDPTLLRIAEAHGVTSAQVIVAWHVAHEFVVIPKSSQPERMATNAAGAKVELTADEVAEIDALGH